MASNFDQAPPKPHFQLEISYLSEYPQSEIKPGNRIEQFQHYLEEHKSFEILRLALTYFATNFKLLFSVILPIVSLLAFMSLFEIKLQNIIPGFPAVLNVIEEMLNWVEKLVDLRGNFFYYLVQVCLFYFVLHPMLQIISFIIITKFASKVESGETQLTLKDALCKHGFKGVLITYLSVHLVSAATLLGLIWVVLNHPSFESKSRIWYEFEFNSVGLYLNLLQFAIFMGLMYVYVDWYVFWNMGIVLFVMEKETEIQAFGLSGYYWNRGKSTRLYLMSLFFVYSNALCNSTSGGFLGGICIAAIVVYCLVELSKSREFVLTFRAD